MYNPFGGRFLSRDPINYSDGNNLFSNNFLLAKLDPSGTQAQGPCCCDEDAEPEIVDGELPDTRMDKGKKALYTRGFVGYKERVWNAARTSWELAGPYNGNSQCGRRFDFEWSITFVNKSVRLAIEDVSIGYGPFAVAISLTNTPGHANVVEHAKSSGWQGKCSKYDAKLYVEIVEVGLWYERFDHWQPYGSNFPPTPSLFLANSKYYTGKWQIVVTRECCDPQK
jgi:hypothetical protein